MATATLAIMTWLVLRYWLPPRKVLQMGSTQRPSMVSSRATIRRLGGVQACAAETAACIATSVKNASTGLATSDTGLICALAAAAAAFDGPNYESARHLPALSPAD